MVHLAFTSVAAWLFLLVFPEHWHINNEPQAWWRERSMPLWPLSTQYGSRCRWGNDATAWLDYYNSILVSPSDPCPVPSSLSQLSTTGTGTGQGWLGQGWLGPVLSLAGGKCRIAQLQDLLGNSQHEALMMNSNTSSFEVKLGSNGSCRAYYLQAAAVQCLLWPPLSFIRAWTRFNTVWTLLRFLLFL